MTAWLSRLWWKFRGRRFVRVQLNTGDAIDGIFVGKKVGHYVLKGSYFFASNDPERGVEMVGETWIPKDRVFLLNVK